MVNHGLGGRGVVVVALHDEIAAGAKLALFANGDGRAIERIDDLHFRMRQRPADGGHSQLNGIVGGTLRNHRRSLGKAIADG